MSIYKKYVCHTLSPEHSRNIFCLLQTKKQAGFTLAELLVAVVAIGILAAIAIPVMTPMLESAQHKKAAREIASILRETRSRAISENLEHEVSFDLTKNCCSVRRGDRANGTIPFTSSPASWTLGIRQLKL